MTLLARVVKMSPDLEQGLHAFASAPLSPATAFRHQPANQLSEASQL